MEGPDQQVILMLWLAQPEQAQARLAYFLNLNR
jgi:hypothetical protein